MSKKDEINLLKRLYQYGEEGLTIDPNIAREIEEMIELLKTELEPSDISQWPNPAKEELRYGPTKLEQAVPEPTVGSDRLREIAEAVWEYSCPAKRHVLEMADEFDKLQAENIELKDSVIGNKKNADYLAEKIEHLQSELKAKDASNNYLQSELAAAKRSVVGRQDEVAELRNELKAKDAEIERLGNAIGNCVGIIRASAQVNTKLLADKLEQTLTDTARQ